MNNLYIIFLANHGLITKPSSHNTKYGRNLKYAQIIIYDSKNI